MSPVWLVFAVHALMCTVDGNGPAGAEFLKHVIGDMPKVTRKMDDRIDVEEYIPDDAPRPYHGNEIQLLSKLPVNYGHNAVRDDFGGGGGEFSPKRLFRLLIFRFCFLLFSVFAARSQNNPAAFPQASDTQTRIVNQGQQQPGNAIPQSVIDALSGKFNHLGRLIGRRLTAAIVSKWTPVAPRVPPSAGGVVYRSELFPVGERAPGNCTGQTPPGRDFVSLSVSSDQTYSPRAFKLSSPFAVDADTVLA